MSFCYHGNSSLTLSDIMEHNIMKPAKIANIINIVARNNKIVVIADNNQPEHELVPETIDELKCYKNLLTFGVTRSENDWSIAYRNPEGECVRQSFKPNKDGVLVEIPEI